MFFTNFSLFCFLCLDSFILSSRSALSFLCLCVASAACVYLCQAFYEGSAGRTTEPQDAHMQPRYTLHSINSAHSKHFHADAHNPPLTDLASALHPDGLSSTLQCEFTTALPPGLITEKRSASPLADPPPLRKHKEKMISFQLGQAQGDFTAVFAHSVRPDSLVHMCGAERLSSGSALVVDVHEQSCFFHLLSAAPLPKTVTLPERGEAFSWIRLPVWM